MPAPASYVDNVRYVVNGEQVEASVANRAVQELKSNTDYLKNAMNALGTKAYVAALGVPLSSNTVVGTPVYFNNSTSQYEPAQAISGKEVVVGVVVAKSTSTVGDIVIAGVATFTIATSVFTPLKPVSNPPGRYYLGQLLPGTLTKTLPVNSSGGSPAIQVSVLVVNGQGQVFVLPYEFRQGSTGAQGPQGPIGPQGPQGPQGPDASAYTWDAYRTVPSILAGGQSWYRAAGFIASTIVSFVPTNNRIYAVPFLSTRNGTIDRLAVNVVSAAVDVGSTARLGIYASGGPTSPAPSTLLLDAGTVAVDSTGVKTLTISQQLAAGTLYWFVILFDTISSKTPSSMAGNNGLGAPAVIGLLGTNIGDSDFYAIYKTMSFGALPSTFPAGSITGVPAGNTSPLIACRYSA